MKKVLLIVFGSVAAVGLVLAIVGFAMGGWFGSLIFDRGRVLYGERQEVTDIGEAPAWARNWRNTWQIFGWGDWRDFDYDWGYSSDTSIGTQETTDSISAPFTQEGSSVRVDIEIDAGYLTVQTGDEWGLEVKGPLAVTSEMEDGEWKLESKTNLDNIRSSSQNWGSRPRFYHNGVDVTTEYILTLPKNVGELDVSLAIGLVEIEGLVMDKGDFSVDMGKMDLRDCEATKADLSADMGAIEATGFTSKLCSLNVSMGSIEYEGDVTERLEADCDMGSIRCTVSDPGEYGYEVNVGLGAITIGGANKAHPFSDTDKSSNTHLTPFYDLECEMGAIEVMFS